MRPRLARVSGQTEPESNELRECTKSSVPFSQNCVQFRELHCVVAGAGVGWAEKVLSTAEEGELVSVQVINTF